MFQIFFGFTLLLLTMFLPLFSVNIPDTERIMVMCTAVLLIARGLDTMEYFRKFTTFFDEDLEEENNEDSEK